ncbi:MAG: branched-chain amino acid ABC transporter permease [Bacteriovoracaceae bacterium]|nr:branched-chain amino acid ABC transporter permease [Bacteriovoracaceae bacterium]
MEEFIQHTINGLSLGSIYALVALGYTMVFGVLQLINFAHGDIFMVGSFFGLYAMRFFAPHFQPGPVLAILVMGCAMTASAVLGVLIEHLGYKPMRRAPRINILITAIGISLFLEYGGQLVFGASPQFFPPFFEKTQFHIFDSVTIDSNQISIFLIACLLMTALQFLVFKTQFGRSMRALSHSLDTANLIGINVNQVIRITFMLGSTLAGAAGVLYALAYPKVEPLMGVLPGLKAFVAAVLGGIGNITGAVIGALILGLSETYVAGYISSTYRDALAFIILIIVLLVRPSGLLGKKRIEKV